MNDATCRKLRGKLIRTLNCFVEVIKSLTRDNNRRDSDELNMLCNTSKPAYKNNDVA